ncbi:DEAD/DEAH box helicase family protein [soil metagenome]
MAAAGHSEEAFEEVIESWLVDHGGYLQGSRSNVDVTRGVDTAELFAFLGATQHEAWSRLIALHGGDPDEAQRRFVDRLVGQLDERGTVDVLRHGVEDLGVALRLASFRPASGLNPDLEARYQANRLTVIRQLHHSPTAKGRSVDLGLFVNGVPVATAELKNPLTGQRVGDAMRQYAEDRDGSDPLLRRCVVHFAVDPDQVMMTTRLAGRDTRFLPFNQGTAGPGEPGGAGNPGATGGRHSTAYLWESVWARDPWLDLLARFVHSEQPEEPKRSKAARRQGQLIFPRFHQWHAVRALAAHAGENGPGHRYLVQHSAGSGKSNTIAWLAHRLSSLHDVDDRKVFDKVIVITDRRVLDRQLQDTIFQFEHAHGVVARIDTDSAQLAEALAGHEAKVIITTLQKFPYVVGQVGELAGTRFAVVIDEAHSSQGGDASTHMKAVLSGGPDGPVAEIEGEVEVDRDPVDGQDEVAAAVEEMVAARGPQERLSLFAFTATPKARTLELFGLLGADGQPTHRATHVYSLRQAIEEGFILDVLRSYTTYATYYRIENAGLDDPEVDKRAAAARIAAFVSLHDEVAAQKARVIVDHFRAHTAAQIGGRAKAMVVCRSRLHAVRMRQAIDTYLRAQGVALGCLVAFSGTVTDPDTGASLTESAMNGFPESETATRFATRDHQILVVAEKFQTGFDQPLLHTMFGDKKLSGVNAVQTLSRLNRMAPGKDSTFILDFVNEADTIGAAFEPFYDASLAIPTDPNALFDARRELENYDVIRAADVEALAAAWFATSASDRARRESHGSLYTHLAPAVTRFDELDADDQDAFRRALDRFVSLYTFVTQILPLAETELEKRYLYCRLLVLRLPARPTVTLDVDVALTHLRVAETGRQAIALDGDADPLVAFAPDGGGSQYLPGMEPLSEVIKRFNEAFGGLIHEADRLNIDGLGARMVDDALLQAQAVANTDAGFAQVFEDRFGEFVAGHLKGNEELLIRLLDDPDFSGVVKDYLRPWVQARARVRHDAVAPVADLLGREEDQTFELKSTLRWDLAASAKNKVLEQVVVKTVAAFLNSRVGGVLLIGADDEGGVIGLDNDYVSLAKEGHADRDRFRLHLTQLLINAVGEAATSQVTVAIESVDGHDVARVHVEPSAFPVLQQVKGTDGPTLWVRLDAGTRAVTDAAEIDRFIATRWPGTAT